MTELTTTTHTSVKDWLLKVFADMDTSENGFFKVRYNDAREVKVVRLSEVFTKAEINKIKALHPKKHMCYKNAFLLTELFPGRVKYVEGMVECIVGVDHAFNLVDDKYYVDITEELVLKNDPDQLNYLAFKDWGIDEVRRLLLEHKVWGDFYRLEFFKHFKPNKSNGKTFKQILAELAEKGEVQVLKELADECQNITRTLSFILDEHPDKKKDLDHASACILMGGLQIAILSKELSLKDTKEK